MNAKKRSSSLCLLLAGAWLWGCATLTAPFDPAALNQATTLRAKALELMGKASGPYTAQEGEVSTVRQLLEAATAYAQARPKNGEAAKQWEVMADPNSNLLGGFLSRWQTSGTLSPVFIGEAQGVVATGFDEIIRLEEARR